MKKEKINYREFYEQSEREKKALSMKQQLKTKGGITNE